MGESSNRMFDFNVAKHRGMWGKLWPRRRRWKAISFPEDVSAGRKDSNNTQSCRTKRFGFSDKDYNDNQCETFDCPEASRSSRPSVGQVAQGGFEAEMAKLLNQLRRDQVIREIPPSESSSAEVMWSSCPSLWKYADGGFEADMAKILEELRSEKTHRPTSTAGTRIQKSIAPQAA